MMTRENRMEKLQANGIETGKFFSVNLPEGLKPGSSIQLVINENGMPVFVNQMGMQTTIDPIQEEIFTNGYVRNTKLHRRWVMAQMFRMLNHKPGRWDRTGNGYNDYVDNILSYDYQFTMMLEEVRVLSILEREDRDSFEERSTFFTKYVVTETCLDYLNKLKNYVERLPEKHCKGIPYKRIKGMDIFVEDLQKKLYQEFEWKITKINCAKSYAEMYRLLGAFKRSMVKLDPSTPKCREWKEAYKGAGSYYTLKNMVMFHDCVLLPVDNRARETGEVLKGCAAEKYLESKLGEYEGYQYFALLKKTIEDNGFDFDKRMEEIYG